MSSGYPNPEGSPGQPPPGGYPPPGYPPPGYPPAQPGQYPAQPGQYPAQPGQYPGQPQYQAQPGQYPAQPQYPGQASAPPYQGQPGHPQYPGQPGYPGGAVPPGYPPGQVPVPGAPGPKRNPALIIGIVAAAVVVVAVAAGAFFFLKGSSTSSPEAVAEAFVDAINDNDLNAAKGLVCARYANDVDDETDIDGTGLGMTSTWEVSSVDEIDSGSAMATLKITVKYQGQTMPSQTFKVAIVKEGGEWKVCGPA